MNVTLDGLLSLLWEKTTTSKGPVNISVSMLENQPIRDMLPEICENLRVLLYLVLIDSYDAWLFLRKSQSVPDIPDRVIQYCTKHEAVAIPRGKTLQDRIIVQTNIVQQAYTPIPVLSSDLEKLTNKIMERAYGTAGFDMEDMSHVNIASKQLKRLQSYNSYFNYMDKTPTNIPVIFGANPKAEMNIYNDLLMSHEKPAHAMPSLSTWFHIPFREKLAVVRKLCAFETDLKPLSIQSVNQAVSDFYNCCIADEDAVVRVLEHYPVFTENTADSKRKIPHI